MYRVVQVIGFPRPRGDGPTVTLTARDVDGVSPPTRGWTPFASLIALGWKGFPAHAGMDPPTPTPWQSSTRFPRPRGDGPRSRGRAPRRRSVSPPTRGWTQAADLVDHAGHGFPAHAGMDLTPYGKAEDIVGFPRPRGDGPCPSLRMRRSGAVSPPTRGWTAIHRPRPGCGHGFPAHAGMDPVAMDQRRANAGFPRPRGDGPSDGHRLPLRRLVSPPTRGWT